MNGATMALLECINESEHYLVHTLDSVLIKHAVAEALAEIDRLRSDLTAANERVRELTRWLDAMNLLHVADSSIVQKANRLMCAADGAIVRLDLIAAQRAIMEAVRETGAILDGDTARDCGADTALAGGGKEG